MKKFYEEQGNKNVIFATEEITNPNVKSKPNAMIFPLNTVLDKVATLHLHNGILFDCKKKRNHETCCYMDKIWRASCSMKLVKGGTSIK